MFQTLTARSSPQLCFPAGPGLRKGTVAQDLMPTCTTLMGGGDQHRPLARLEETTDRSRMIQWVTTHRISPVRTGWKATK